MVLVRTKKKEGYYGLQIGAVDELKMKNVRESSLILFGPMSCDHQCDQA